MSFAVLHKWVAYLLSGLGLFALSLGHELSTPMSSLLLVAFVGSYFVDGPILHRPAYTRSWTALVVAFLVLQLLRAILVEPSLSLALEFAAVLQLSRLYSRRTAQDYQQIAVLSFLHLIAATVLSTEVTYALVFVGFVIATPWMLALSHLRREIEANYPAYTDDGGRSRAALTRVLASKRVVGARFLVATALLSVPLFAMTLAIFLIVPRVGQGFLQFGRGRGDKVAGFGNQVELGGFGVIRDDPTVVLRVTPEPAQDLKSRRLTLRLRGTSFDRYDGRLWTRSLDTSSPLDLSANQQFVLLRPPRSTDLTLHIVLDHLEQPVVFVPTGTVALAVDAKVVRAQRVPRRLRHGPGYDIRYADHDQAGLIYDAYVSPNGDEQALRPLQKEAMELYLQVPPRHEQVAALAREVTAGAKTPVEKAQALRMYLQSSRFAYSLAQPSMGSDELPLAAFLFRERKGHCEYFSTAMAIMLRTLGIPARNVTGFVGGQYNPYGEYYALRQGDAHSWVEAYVEGQGWLTFDPTPTSSAELGRQEGLWSDLHALVDAIRMRWITTVVGYDLRAQLGILRQVKSLFDDSDSSEQPSEGQDEMSANAMRDAARSLLLWTATLLALGGLAWLWRRRRRRGEGTDRLSADAAEAVKLYRALEQVLRRRGYPRAQTVTPLEHASCLRELGFPDADAVMEVTEGYLRARYGTPPLSRQQLDLLRERVTQIERAAPRSSSPSPEHPSV